jgi:hypothetical protein
MIPVWKSTAILLFLTNVGSAGELITDCREPTPEHLADNQKWISEKEFKCQLKSSTEDTFKYSKGFDGLTYNLKKIIRIDNPTSKIVRSAYASCKFYWQGKLVADEASSSSPIMPGLFGYIEVKVEKAPVVPDRTVCEFWRATPKEE